MKLLVALCLVAAVYAAPPPRYNPDGDVQILRYDNDNLGLGNFKYSYEQSDGQAQNVNGELKNEGREDESLVIRGTYTWIGPDNVKYTITYIADENGFQPEIEQGPGGGVPPAVVASLLG